MATMHTPTLLMPSQSSGSASVKTAQRMRVIQFRLGTLNLAIRIEAVVKVLNNFHVDSSGTNSFGVAHLQDGEMTIFDLQRQLFLESALPEPGRKSHLIVLKSTQGEPYAIPVVEVPVLLDIPTTDLRVLPESYRRADTLRMATHVVVVNQNQQTPQTIFLLDPNLLNLAKVS